MPGNGHLRHYKATVRSDAHKPETPVFVIFTVSRNSISLTTMANLEVPLLRRFRETS